MTPYDPSTRTTGFARGLAQDSARRAKEKMAPRALPVGLHFKKIRDNFKEVACALPAHYHLWNIAKRALFRNTPIDLFTSLWMHTDWYFKYALNSHKADIMICSHPWPSLCMDKRKGQMFIYDAHNCEYILMDRILSRHPLKHWVLRRVKKIEADACKKSDLILACSENEKNELLRIYKADPEKIIIVSNGTNVVTQKSSTDKGEAKKKLGFSSADKIVIFIGAYYKPNIEAVNFIVSKLAFQLPDFKLLVVGTVADAFKNRKVIPNIRFLGGVSEDILQAALTAADIAINPVLEGSGINIKMLDYMSYGLPILTTSCGARGIDTAQREPFIVSELDEFSDNIRRIMLKSELYRKMSQEAREVAGERYNWQAISKKLQETILKKMGYKENVHKTSDYSALSLSSNR